MPNTIDLEKWATGLILFLRSTATVSACPHFLMLTCGSVDLRETHFQSSVGWNIRQNGPNKATLNFTQRGSGVMDNPWELCDVTFTVSCKKKLIKAPFTYKREKMFIPFLFVNNLLQPSSTSFRVKNQNEAA